MTIPFTNPLHLYRSLLRETTYFFDPNARRWTQNYIKSSFRKNATKIQEDGRWRNIPYDPNNAPSLHERHLLKRGRKFLFGIQRANQGGQRALKTLLQLVYGRKGRRKRELIAPLMRQDKNVDPKSITGADGKQISRLMTGQIPAKYTKDWKAPEDFVSLLQTQNQVSAYLSIKKSIRLKPLIDEKNRWGRPMPLCRVKNMTKKWYAKMASVLMPPVTEEEWNTLKAIVLRKKEFKLIPRRTLAKRSQIVDETEEAENTAKSLMLGLAKPPNRLANSNMTRPHNMTARFLSRFYSKHILNHTPITVPNPNARGVVSKWDDGRRMVLEAHTPKNTSQLEALFG